MSEPTKLLPDYTANIRAPSQEATLTVHLLTSMVIPTYHFSGLVNLGNKNTNKNLSLQKSFVKKKIKPIFYKNILQALLRHLFC